MKKVLYYSILSLFFSCYLQAQQSSQDSVKTQSSNKTADKKEEKKRNVANNQPIPNSNIDTLGEDYYKPLESEPLRKAVDTHLQAITAVCKTQQSLSKKIDNLNKSLKELMGLIKSYLKQRLKTRDSLFLGSIKDNIEELLNFIDIAQKSSSANLFNDFVTYYYFYYNLPDNTSVKEFPDEWAKQIYFSLECLYEK